VQPRTLAPMDALTARRAAWARRGQEGTFTGLSPALAHARQPQHNYQPLQPPGGCSETEPHGYIEKPGSPALFASSSSCIIFEMKIAVCSVIFPEIPTLDGKVSWDNLVRKINKSLKTLLFWGMLHSTRSTLPAFSLEPPKQSSKQILLSPFYR